MAIELTEIGTTAKGYKVQAIAPGCRVSPMRNHRGGEIAVDDKGRVMYVWHTFAVLYGVDSIMRACNAYHAKRDVEAEADDKEPFRNGPDTNF